MLKYIYIILLLSNPSHSQTDSANINLANDTHGHISNDTSHIKIISYPDVTWYERNEGAIIGSFVGAFLAGIIALLSIYLTARSNKRQRREREIEIYCGFLYSIKIELIYHSKNHNNLIEELRMIKHNSLLANEIITDSPSRNISIPFLRELRSKLIDTELFNTKILLTLSAYINKCDLVNSDIKLERLMKVSEKFKEQVNFAESTKSYFNIVIEETENLKKSIPEIIKQINADLTLLGKTSEIDEGEYLKVTD